MQRCVLGGAATALRAFRATPRISARMVRYDAFADRHIGPSRLEKQQMLDFLGFTTLDELTNTNVPNQIKLEREMDLPKPIDEYSMLRELKKISEMNKIYRSYIGMGYYDTIVPAVILRNITQNIGWISQYTPYQAEISQGRLESLLNFQTMVADLTGLPSTNASLLDESTAVAEAIALAARATRRHKALLDPYLHPQNIDVAKTRSGLLGITLGELSFESFNIDKDVAAVVVQYPDTEGRIRNLEKLIAKAHENGLRRTVVSEFPDTGSILLRSDGSNTAEISWRSWSRYRCWISAEDTTPTSLRFGVPLGYGGPHAGFMAVKKDAKNTLGRMMPGRIIGVSRGANGEKAFRLALQTREQHIRRDKATSNICTAQALLANMSAMYAVYHGPKRLLEIARAIHKSTAFLESELHKAGHSTAHKDYFDTLKVTVKDLAAFKQRAEEKHMNFRYFADGSVGVSLDEATKPSDLLDLLYVFNGTTKLTEVRADEVADIVPETASPLIGNSEHARTSVFLEHPIFNTYHSEAMLVRYIKRLENKDVSLVHSMIPLGSCTMKLNASAELIPITWDSFNGLHPFAPVSQAAGFQKLFNDVEKWLCEITGYDNFSLQPNSGANGEYTGLLTIRKYLNNLGQQQRNAERFKDELAAIMVTYPSTHGVFESSIRDVIDKVHEHGGQVYLDGANMNAQVGLCRPGDYGSDVSHLNLHKTFCIPHGGGGPGIGPIGVKKHLAPFLPGHPVIPVDGRTDGAVAGAPWGSASILPITWAYIRMMGHAGLKKASQVAILNANYMARRLEGAYRIVYKDEQGLVAHEFILDCKPFKKSAGVEVVDIAKRLMDYGFHSPTMSWPVHDCLMIEPTESEDKGEMDRLVDALLAIREEIAMIERGELDKQKNPLKVRNPLECVNVTRFPFQMAPHTLAKVASNDWDLPYSRELAALPKPWCHHKTWPTTGRIDDQYGDKNLVCTCPPMEAYQ
ncbi:hypothetical protein ANCDUO_01817 [Ancylostoma duodenale]|uniref:glycine dehydrogenase (aminomethyl-transferring) n=1 Tax=Ancylostoma duodenale TaxID=51022 RepID=A0A0C2H290_9BILA|nr:hypothetical protein ANCDUO_01817 [Ancylostoma duodenale]